MASTRLSTDAVVLRSMRYSESDRILHAITPDHGRIGAIARGARRPRSKLGGRLEPLSVVRLELVRGRGDLFTVAGVASLAVHHRILTSHAALTQAQEACHVVDRTCVPDEPAPRAFGLLWSLLALLDAHPERAGEGLALTFGLKLLYALGLQPALGACVACGRPGPLVAFDLAQGGAVCDRCRARASTTISRAALGFMVEALGAPLGDAPDVAAVDASAVCRVVSGLAEHHLGVRLRAGRAPVGAPPMGR